MNRRCSRGLALASFLAMAIYLASCASPANHTAMEASLSGATSGVGGVGSGTGTAVPIATVVPRNGYAVKVNVTGGSDTTATTSSNIADADFKAAIEASIVSAGLFKSTQSTPGAPFELNARIVQLSKPSIGFSFTVELEVAWTLTRTSDQAPVLRKVIKSSHTATTSDAFVGATRLRLAVEGAARKNIDSAIQVIGALKY